LNELLGLSRVVTVIGLALPRLVNRIAVRHPACREIGKYADRVVATVSTPQADDLALVGFADLAMQELPLSVRIMEYDEEWCVVVYDLLRGLGKSVHRLPKWPSLRKKAVLMSQYGSH
jgi:hypothetical protein